MCLIDNEITSFHDSLLLLFEYCWFPCQFICSLWLKCSYAGCAYTGYNVFEQVICNGCVTLLTWLIEYGAVGIEADDDRIELFMSQVNDKDITELIAAGREKLASVPAGGGGAVAVAATGGAGGAAPAAAESKKEEKVEQEESDEVIFLSFQFILNSLSLFNPWFSMSNSWGINLVQSIWAYMVSKASYTAQCTTIKSNFFVFCMSCSIVIYLFYSAYRVLYISAGNGFQSL